MCLEVCQEAINNALKYAQFDNLHIKIEQEGRSFSVEIKDDGIGIDPEAIQNGMGLANMKERIEQIGGSFELKSTPNHGTSVKLSLAVNTPIVV
jgi:signal transduction histidine kinase